MPAQTTNLASIAHVLWKLLEYHEVDPMPVFREARLDPERMKKPGARFRVQLIERAWNLANTRITDPCFGLKAAEVWHPSDFGALGYAMLASDTLKTAFYRMERYHKVIVGWKFVSISESGDGFTLSFSPGPSSYRVFARTDAMMSVLLEICRKNLGRDISPKLVTFRHERPSCSREYDRLFACPVRFAWETDSLVLPFDVASRPLPGANQDFLLASEEIIWNYLAQMEGNNVVQKVKKIIVSQLPSGNVTDETVAYELFTSSRSLQRKLSAQGTSFRRLLDDVRFHMARKYLLKRDADMAEITFLLGFSSQSSFSRAFKRWSGISPREFARKHAPSPEQHQPSA